MGMFYKLTSFILEIKFWFSSYILEWSPYICRRLHILIYIL